MKNNWLLLVLGVVIVGFSACNNSVANLSGSAAELIPESATAVVSFDLKSLMEKANMDKVKQMDFYKDAVADAAREGGEVAAKVLENPENSGINLSEKAYFFADLQGKEEGILGLVFKVSDAQKMEDLILEGEGEIEEIKGISYLTGADQFTIAWKGDRGFMGTLLNRNQGDLKTAVLAIFDNKSNISSNSEATKALGESGDINYYFTTDALTKVFNSELAMAEVFVGANYLNDNHLWGSTSFENGEIKSLSYANLSKDLNSDLKLIFADGSETDFSRYIPKENLIMSMTGKLNVPGINQLLKDKNLNGLLNVQLNSVGLSADDIAKAIDGDMVLAVNKLDDNKEPSVLFAIKIGDRKKLNEILGKGEALGVLEKQGDDIYNFGGFGSPEGQVIIKDKLLIFSNNMDLLETLKDGKLAKSESIDKDTYTEINGVLGAYVNYETIMEYNYDQGGQQFGYGNMKEAITTFNWGKSTSIVTMKDDSKNALELIIESINQQYLDAKKQEAEWEKRWEEMETEELESQGLEYETVEEETIEM